MHGFLNNLAQLFSLKSRSGNAFVEGRLKVKVTLEGQMMKLLKIELIQAITCTFIHGFLNNSAQLFSATS